MNGVYDAVQGTITALTNGQSPPAQTYTKLVGTFPSNKASFTANSTDNAAKALWHFAQVFFTEFPDYKPNNNRISIWTESYGGRYGPATAAFFQEQNEKILNGTITDKSDNFVIHLDTLGIINGCVDYLSMGTSYPTIAFNNTFGIQAIDQQTYQSSLALWSNPGGCRDQIVSCQQQAAKLDPTNSGINTQVNSICARAAQTCMYVLLRASCRILY